MTLSPEHNAAGLSALRQMAALVDAWALTQAMTPEEQRAEAAARAQAQTADGGHAAQEPGAAPAST